MYRKRRSTEELLTVLYVFEGCKWPWSEFSCIMDSYISAKYFTIEYQHKLPFKAHFLQRKQEM